MARAIHETMRHYDAWKDDYDFDASTGEFHQRGEQPPGLRLQDFDPLPAH